MTGLEPATFGVTSRHSNQLSYTPSKKDFPPSRSPNIAQLMACVKSLNFRKVPLDSGPS